jgi:hypothetical protein
VLPGGRIAAETSVTNFINDFSATPSSWSVKTAGLKVLAALNRWLHGQGQHYHHAPSRLFNHLYCLSHARHIPAMSFMLVTAVCGDYADE